MNRKVTSFALLLGLSAGAAFGQATDAGAPTAPKKLWDSSASLGLTLTRGNTKTLNIIGDLQTARKWEQNELNLGASGVYAEDRDNKSAEQLRGYAQYNRLFTERLFGYLRVDALHDAISDVKYRVALSPGVGYYFIKSQDTSLRAEFGPGYVFEKVGQTENDYLTLRLAERFDKKINDRVKIWQSAEILPEASDFNNFILTAEIGLETSLTKQLNLRTYLQDIYDNVPAKGRSSNDLKFVTAIAYKF